MCDSSPTSNCVSLAMFSNSRLPDAQNSTESVVAVVGAIYCHNTPAMRAWIRSWRTLVCTCSVAPPPCRAIIRLGSTWEQRVVDRMSIVYSTVQYW